MPPKFQSSFIPKAPQTFSVGAGIPSSPSFGGGKLNLISFITTTIFLLTLVAGMGIFGYKYFVNSSINKMIQKIESSRSYLTSEQIINILELDQRINGARILLNNHQAISPFFRFLEVQTPQSVKYNEFNYSKTGEGNIFTLNGVARSYGSLALVADIVYKNTNLLNPIFSNIKLDDSGNVEFTLRAGIEPNFISYLKLIESNALNNTSAPSFPTLGNFTSTTTPLNSGGAPMSSTTTQMFRGAPPQGTIISTSTTPFNSGRATTTRTN